jgi:hypothetical protein
MRKTVYSCKERTQAVWKDKFVALTSGPKRRPVVLFVGHLRDQRPVGRGEIFLEDSSESRIDVSFLTPMGMGCQWRRVVLAHYPSMFGPQPFATDTRPKHGIKNPCRFHVGPQPTVPCNGIVRTPAHHPLNDERVISHDDVRSWC